MTSINATTRAELKAFIERIERVNDDIQSLKDDVKDIYGEAKGRGYNVATLRKIIAIRKQDPDKRAEQEAILDTYMAALGMIQPDLFDEAA